MPYVGGSLVSLFDRDAQAATKLAARRMAEKGTDRMHEVTVQNTPIDTGNLRTSWYTLPAQKVAHLLSPTDGAYQGTVATDVDYAPHVEYGTGLWGPSHSYYAITAKPGGVLAFQPRENIKGARFDLEAGRYRPSEAKLDPDTGLPVLGDTVFVTRVMHPGSPGQHMLQTGGFIAEAEADEGTLFEGVLTEWARTVEAGAD